MTSVGKRHGRPRTASPVRGEKPLGVRISAELRARLDAVCEATGYTRAEVMALGIEAAEARIAERERGRK